MRLRSRNDLSLNGRFPEVAAALEADRRRRRRRSTARSSPSTARRPASRACSSAASAPVAVVLYVFDLLHLAGHDTPRCPLRARKALLRRALRLDGPIRLTPHRNRDGEALYREACRRGLGGPDRQARRRAVHPRALPRLAQVQVLGRAGARDRRLHRAARQPHRPRRAAARLLRGRPPALRGQGRHRLHARHPARPRRAPGARCAATSSPFADALRERDATWVRAASSSPRSASRSGRATGGCATRASWGCATTRPRRRWCGSERRDRPGRPAPGGRSATPTASCSPTRG